MPPLTTNPSSGDTISLSLQKINQLLLNMMPPLSPRTEIGPYSTLSPTGGDTLSSSLVKINSILALVQANGGWLTVPPGGVSNAALIKKSAANYDTTWTAAPVERARPIALALPQRSFGALNTWYDVLPPTIFPLPPRPGNSLIQIALSLHLSWSATSGNQGLCDWTNDAGAHFRRTFHMLVQKSDDASVDGVDLGFWNVVNGTSPTVSIQGRQYVGSLGMLVIGADTAAWPMLTSYALITDQGPL